MQKSKLEEAAIRAIKLAGFSEPESEYRFDLVRKFRFDLAYPKDKIAIELEGGIWSGGRHTRGNGFIKDTEKYNLATIQGWRILRYTTQTLHQIPIDLMLLTERKAKQNECNI